MAENFWTDIEDALAEGAVRLSDSMVEKIRGGPRPPGTNPVSRAEHLRRYLLFSRPMAVLAPGELAERAKLRDAWLAKLDETEIREWALVGEDLRLKAIGPPPPEPDWLRLPAVPPIATMDQALGDMPFPPPPQSDQEIA